MVHVVGVRSVGEQQTYDIEVDHPSHQFYLSNGLLTSNSHAVSYALDSYMCAYLLTKHEKEWLCAYAEIQSSDSKKRARALAEIKAFGYSLSKIDINFAGKTWTIIPGKKFMPSFTTLDGIGPAAVDEILEKRPYSSIEELLWNDDGTWKHSKLNKRVMENLIKIGAFESMDLVGERKLFSNYKHMHQCIIENWGLLKKKNGRESFQQLIESTRCDDWSRDEKVEMYMSLMGELDLSLIIPNEKIEQFRKKNVTSLDDIEEGQKAIHWFIVADMKPAKTKNGKPYMKVSAVGESGTHHVMFIWSWKPGSNNITKYGAYLGELEKTDFGISTMPWKIREVT